MAFAIQGPGMLRIWFRVHFMWLCNPIYYWASKVIIQSSKGVINTMHNDIDGRQEMKRERINNKTEGEQWIKR